MNKTLLLIIIDFLFLNLIALTQWEKLEVSRPPAPVGTEVAAEPGDAPSTRQNDLVAAMKQSLTDEQSAKTELAQQLASARDALSQRDQNLNQLESERTKLSESLASTQQTAEQLRQRVSAATQDAAMTKEQLDQLQKELAAKRAEAERQQQAMAEQEKALADLKAQQGQAQERIQNLSVAVKVAEQEKQMLRDTAETFKQQAAAERQEREKVQQTTTQLAQGVGQLAEKSGELTKEIRENRPINANVLFHEFLNNRVTTSFTAYRKSFLGPITRDRDARTIFVTDGDKVYALLHIDDTPFSVRESGDDWEKLTAAFSRGSYRSTVDRIEFLSVDPRVVVLPVDPGQVAALGVKVYKTALDPFKFPEAVLVNGGGAGYGEVAFKLDASEPGYVRVDNRLLKRLFGDFAPSRGDLVFSKTGELLGIMVNSDYCAVVNNFLPSRTIRTGDDVKAQQTGEILDAVAARYRALPLKLQ